jgi:hypothetical protein
MDAKQIRALLAGAGRDNPVVKATDALISDHAADWLSCATGQKVPTDERHYYSGAAFALQALRKSLEDILNNKN